MNSQLNFSGLQVRYVKAGELEVAGFGHGEQYRVIRRLRIAGDESEVLACV